MLRSVGLSLIFVLFTGCGAPRASAEWCSMAADVVADLKVARDIIESEGTLPAGMGERLGGDEIRLLTSVPETYLGDFEIIYRSSASHRALEGYAAAVARGRSMIEESCPDMADSDIDLIVQRSVAP